MPGINDPDMQAVLTPDTSASTPPVGDPDMQAVLSAPPQNAAPPSLMDKYKGYMETEANLVTGGIGGLAGGLGYLGSLAITRDPAKAAQAQRAIQNDLTYQPRTALGKEWSKGVQDAAGYLGQKGGDIAGSAVANAATDVGLPPTVAGEAGAAANTLYNVPQFLVGSKLGQTESGMEPAPMGAGGEHGLVVPPATSNPTLFNRLAEGVAGKLSTAQHASIINQPIINSVVRSEFGLPEGAPLTPETLNDVRSTAAAPYQAVAAIPEIKFGPQYEAALNKLTQTSGKLSSALPKFKATGADAVNELVDSLKPTNGVMDGETAVELSKTLRNEASSYWSSFKRGGSPLDKALAVAHSGAAEAVENAVEQHLNATGQPELAGQWDNARRTIAKTYTVQSALDGAGNVDARNLGKQLIKGKPLSGKLASLADFANSYPKSANVAWSKESVPGISPLDVTAGSMIGLGTGLATHDPYAAAAGAVYPLARMGIRSGLLSPLGQRLGVPGTSAPLLRSPLGALTKAELSGIPAATEDRE